MSAPYSLDSEHYKKIAKGALIAFTGAGAIGLLTWVGALEINNPMLASLAAWAVPTLINAIKEWRRDS